MACSTCHQCRCVCPPPEDTTREHWVVDNDFSVLRARELEDKHGYVTFAGGRLRNPDMGRMARMGRKHFPERRDAEQHALALLQQAIDKSEAATAQLKARMVELQAAAPA
jgi:hypothetical protein